MVEDKTIWQESEYFESFDGFDPSVAYVPNILMDHLIHANLSAQAEGDEETVARPYVILGAILRASFTPIDERTPPPGYVRGFGEEKLSETTGLSIEIVRQQLRHLLRQNVIAKQGDYTWVRHPEDWRVPISTTGEQQETLEHLEALHIWRMFRLI